jgi:hypothetical protein
MVFILLRTFAVCWRRPSVPAGREGRATGAPPGPARPGMQGTAAESLWSAPATLEALRSRMKPHQPAPIESATSREINGIAVTAMGTSRSNWTAAFS